MSYIKKVLDDIGYPFGVGVGIWVESHNWKHVLIGTFSALLIFLLFPLPQMAWKAFQKWRTNRKMKKIGLDWEDDKMPTFEDNQLPDVSEEQKDELTNLTIRSTSKMLILHLELLKLNYIEGRIEAGTDQNPAFYLLTFRRVKDRFSDETFTKFPQYNDRKDPS